MRNDAGSVIAIGHTLKGRLRKVFLQKVVAEAEKHVDKNEVQSAHVGISQMTQ